MVAVLEKHYSADLTAGSLKVPESRVVVDLLLQVVDAQGWRKALCEQNVLQAGNSATAGRLGGLIRRRLGMMEPNLWQLIRDGSLIPPWLPVQLPNRHSSFAHSPPPHATRDRNAWHQPWAQEVCHVETTTLHQTVQRKGPSVGEPEVSVSKPEISGLASKVP